jgi:hypothetical protein
MKWRGLGSSASGEEPATEDDDQREPARHAALYTGCQSGATVAFLLPMELAVRQGFEFYDWRFSKLVMAWDFWHQDLAGQQLLVI